MYNFFVGGVYKDFPTEIQQDPKLYLARNPNHWQSPSHWSDFFAVNTGSDSSKDTTKEIVFSRKSIDGQKPFLWETMDVQKNL